MLSSPQLQLISHQPGAKVHVLVLFVRLTPTLPGEPLHTYSERCPSTCPSALLNHIFTPQLVTVIQYSIFFTILCKTCMYFVAQWCFVFVFQSFQANCRSISLPHSSCSHLLQPVSVVKGFVWTHHLIKKSVVFMFEIVQKATSCP